MTLAGVDVDGGLAKGPVSSSSLAAGIVGECSKKKRTVKYTLRDVDQEKSMSM